MVEATTSKSKRTQHWTLRLALWLFVGAIAFSVAGMLLLKLVPSAIEIFGPYYPTLVKTPTWTFMMLLALLPVLMYGPSLGWKRIGLFLLWGGLVGGLSELVGTTGILTVADIPLPFGEYHYTDWLGPKFAGHVPYFIPPSWFAMSIVSLDLAHRTTDRTWGNVALGTTYMVLWDVSLDPAMNHAFPFWNYGVDGFFFGMPLSNWFGWAVVSLIIVLGYEYLRDDHSLQHPWAPWVYVLNCLFPIAITLIQGSAVAGLIGALATSVPFLFIWIGNPTYLARSVALLRT